MQLDIVSKTGLRKTFGSILTRVTDRIDSGLLRIEKALVVATGVAIFSMAAIVTANVTMRAAFGRPIPVITVVEIYLLTAAVFLPMGTLQRLDGNVRVELIRKRFPDKVLAISEALTILVGLAVFGYMVQLYVNRTMETWVDGSVTGLSTIQFPLALHWAIAVIGLTSLTLRLLVQFINMTTGGTDDNVTSRGTDDNVTSGGTDDI